MQPDPDDFTVFNRLLSEFVAQPEAAVLDPAFDWYRQGLTSTSVFGRFLAYYIAMESVVIAIKDREVTFGLTLPEETRAERKAWKEECIREKAKLLLDKDPIAFAQEAYFDCVVSLKRATAQILPLVFGQDHEYVKAVLEERDGHSLSSIRSGLAHGQLSLASPEHEGLVLSRVGEMARIAREFLKRLALRLKPNDTPPSWSAKHSFSVSSCDPRATLYATHEEAFPCKHWKIKPEWLD